MESAPRYLVRQTFDTDLPSLELLRSQIIASVTGIARQVLSDVELVATELVTNAHLHGNPPTRFQLYYLADPRRLRMEVTDSGAGLPRLTHPEPRAQHGRGLLLVAAMSTTWGVVTAAVGKTVWAEFVLPPSGIAPGAFDSGQ